MDMEIKITSEQAQKIIADAQARASQVADPPNRSAMDGPLSVRRTKAKSVSPERTWISRFVAW